MRYSGIAVVLALALVSCGGDAGGPTAPAAVAAVAPSLSPARDGPAGVTTSGRPTEYTMTETIYGTLDPCTGETMDITLTTACRTLLKEEFWVTTCSRTGTTTTVYVGDGTHANVASNAVWVYRFMDVLTSEAGARILVEGRWVWDGGPYRVLEFKNTCLGR